MSVTFGLIILGAVLGWLARGWWAFFGVKKSLKRWLHRKHGHRTTAVNCFYYTGDRSFADWGTCQECKNG
jgi:hypothetical protein